MNWPARPEGHTPDKTGDLSEPWWTRDAITWMDQYLRHHKNSFIFEWGCGASTLWLADRSARVISIEHDPAWADLVRLELVRRQGNHRIELCPLGLNYYHRAPTFMDIIIVDGRLRVFCCERAIEVLPSGGILMLDNAEEPIYAEAHELLKDWPVIRTDNGIWRTDIWTKP